MDTKPIRYFQWVSRDTGDVHEVAFRDSIESFLLARSEAHGAELERVRAECADLRGMIDRSGYEVGALGAKRLKPKLGPPPDFDAMDRYRADLAAATAHTERAEAEAARLRAHIDEACDGMNLADLLALAFDAFFTEVQFQIATGRLPYTVSPAHSWAPSGTGFYQCRGCGSIVAAGSGTRVTCRAFYPRIM